MVNHPEPVLTWLQTWNLCSWNFRAWLQQGTCGDGPGGVWNWLLLHYHAKISTHGEKEEEVVCTVLGTIHAYAKINGRLHGPAAPGNFHLFFFFDDMYISWRVCLLSLIISLLPTLQREGVFRTQALRCAFLGQWIVFFSATLNLVSSDWHLHLQANNSLSGHGPIGDQ